MPHRAHTVDEIPDWLTCFAAVEVAKHLVAVLDSGNLVQRCVEALFELIVGMPGGDPGDDLVQVQVAKAIGCGQRVDAGERVGTGGQDVGKRCYLRLTCLLPCVNRVVEAISRCGS